MPPPHPRKPNRPRPDPVEPSMIYKNENVVRVLVDHGYSVEIAQGSYKEYRPTGSGEEIFVATDNITGEKVVGPTRQIRLLWFVEDEVSTTE